MEASYGVTSLELPPDRRLILDDTLTAHIGGRNAICSICERELVPNADAMARWNRKQDGIVPETDWMTVELHGVWGIGRTNADRLGESGKSSGTEGRIGTADSFTIVKRYRFS